MTRAALADLNLDVALYAGKDPADFVDAHPVINAFWERRRQNPASGEATYIKNRPVFYNLHSGTARGLTWHEVEGDLEVVWLLGVAWHTGGDNSDAYDEMRERDSRGLLMPSVDDYLDLEPDPVVFVQEAARQLPMLISMSRLSPESPVEDLVAGMLHVTVLTGRQVMGGTTIEETWVAIRLPPEPGSVLPPEYVAVVLGFLFPGFNLDDLQAHPRFPGHDAGAEIVYNYCRFPA